VYKLDLLPQTILMQTQCYLNQGQPLPFQILKPGIWVI
jgi:hypothetical protein